MDSKLRLEGFTDRWELRRQDGTVETYNRAGQLVLVVGPEGMPTALSYSSGPLSTVTGPYGHKLVFTWSGSTIVSVKDAAGAVVRRIQREPVAGGLTEFAWDGRTETGTAAAAGPYRIEALARFGNRAESSQLLLRSRVDSVTLDAAGSGLVLNTANGSLPLGAVRRVM